MDTKKLCKKENMKGDDCFEITENFDGEIKTCDNIFLFNLKMVCCSGGSQTRTLREVYHFISTQLENLLKYKPKYFINILDGDESFKNRNKFDYLLNKEKYKEVKQYMFVGDMEEFKNYWNTIVIN